VGRKQRRGSRGKETGERKTAERRRSTGSRAEVEAPKLWAGEAPKLCRRTVRIEDEHTLKKKFGCLENTQKQMENVWAPKLFRRTDPPRSHQKVVWMPLGQKGVWVPLGYKTSGAFLLEQCCCPPAMKPSVWAKIKRCRKAGVAGTPATAVVCAGGRLCCSCTGLWRAEEKEEENGGRGGERSGGGGGVVVELDWREASTPPQSWETKTHSRSAPARETGKHDVQHRSPCFIRKYRHICKLHSTTIRATVHTHIQNHFRRLSGGLPICLQKQG